VVKKGTSPVIVPTRALKEGTLADAQVVEAEAEAAQNVTAAEKLDISRVTAPSLRITAEGVEAEATALSVGVAEARKLVIPAAV